MTHRQGSAVTTPRQGTGFFRPSEGMVVAGYRLVRRIGSGGTGTVWEAAGPRNARERVAIKFLSPDVLRENPDLAKRMARESKACRRIASDRVVEVKHFACHQGVPFLIMELVEGETVYARIRRRRMELHEAKLLVSQTCEALGAAHAAGVIHRDIKAGNLILGPRGVKLLDLGFAKLSGAARRRAGAAPSRRSREPTRPPRMGGDPPARRPADDRSGDITALQFAGEHGVGRAPERQAGYRGTGPRRRGASHSTARRSREPTRPPRMGGDPPARRPADDRSGDRSASQFAGEHGVGRAPERQAGFRGTGARRRGASCRRSREPTRPPRMGGDPPARSPADDRSGDRSASQFAGEHGVGRAPERQAGFRGTGARRRSASPRRPSPR